MPIPSQIPDIRLESSKLDLFRKTPGKPGEEISNAPGNRRVLHCSWLIHPNSMPAACVCAFYENKDFPFVHPLRSAFIAHLSPRHNTPGTDLVVGVTSEQSLAVVAPGQADALGLTALLALLNVLGLELVNLALLLEVEDGDAGAGGSAEPVAVGGEDEGVDFVAGVEGVEVLGLVEIPEHGGAVLATGGAEGAVGGDGDGVDVAGVTDVVGLKAAGSELPDLFCLLACAFLTNQVFGFQNTAG